MFPALKDLDPEPMCGCSWQCGMILSVTQGWSKVHESPLFQLHKPWVMLVKPPICKGII